MPSLTHEVVLELLRNQPDLLPTLLQHIGHPEVPPDAIVRVGAADANLMVPVEYRADMVLLVGEPDPTIVFVIEAQLGIDLAKLLKWPAYLANLRVRYKCPVVLVIFTVDEAVMRWASQPIHLGGDSVIVPIVFGPGNLPRIVDVEEARKCPALALLSALAYGKDENAAELVAAAKVAIDLLDKDGDRGYLEAVWRAFNDVASNLLEKMMQLPTNFEYTFPPLRKAFGAGEARGEARGKAEAVLRILVKRGISVPDAAKERVLTCADIDLLTCWFDRAIAAGSIEEVLEG